jgi:hypothetical protein
LNIHYTLTFLANAANIGLYVWNLSIMKKITLAIEWDIDEEVYVVKKPKSHLGGTIKLIVLPSNF